EMRAEGRDPLGARRHDGVEEAALALDPRPHHFARQRPGHEERRVLVARDAFAPAAHGFDGEGDRRAHAWRPMKASTAAESGMAGWAPCARQASAAAALARPSASASARPSASPEAR